MEGPDVTRIGLALVVVLAAAMYVQAQPADDAAALALARLCVSEAGWSCWRTHDGYALHEVVARTARRLGVSYEEAARRRAPRLLGSRAHRSPRLRWVGELSPDAAAPPSWPGPPHLPWSHYRARWVAVLERARLVATFTLDDRDEWSPCDDEPDDWRARDEVIVSRPLADCGDTRNRFFQ